MLTKFWCVIACARVGWAENGRGAGDRAWAGDGQAVRRLHSYDPRPEYTATVRGSRTS